MGKKTNLFYRFKAGILYLLAYIGLGSLTFSQTGTWEVRTSWPGVTDCQFSHSNFVFKNNGKAYIGSFTPTIGSLGQDPGKMYEYIPSIDTWTLYDTVPNSGNDGCYFSYNGYGYYILESVSGASKLDFWKYDIQNKVWTDLSPIIDAWRVTIGEQIYLYSWWELPVVNGKVYLFETYDTVGNSHNHHPRVVEIDLATETITEKNPRPFNFSIYDAPRFVIGDTIYQASFAPISSLALDSSLYAYHPGTDIWVYKGKLPYFGGLGSMFASGTRGYYGMGVTSGDYFPGPGTSNTHEFFSYDPATNSWTELADYPDPTVWDEGVGFEIDGRLYMGLGDNDPQDISSPPCTPGYLLNHSFYEFIPPTAAIEDNAIGNWKLYPNPATSDLFIESGESIHVICIYNAQGKKLMDIDGEDKNAVKIPVEHLCNGMYIVVLYTGNNNRIYTNSFIKS